MEVSTLPAARVAVSGEQLASLIDLLRQQEFQVIAPVSRRGTQVFAPVRSWQEVTPHFFTSGPPAFSLKPWLHPPEFPVFTVARDAEDGAFEILSAGDERQPPRFAFVGVRSCDLAAVARLDRVLLRDRFVDPVYAARRRGCVFVAVACAQPASTCFCASLGTGPRPAAGFDILLERLNSAKISATAGSMDGAALLAALEAVPSPETIADAADEAATQARRIDTQGLKQALYESFEHPRWEQTAARCLSCTSCTSACPTCFCVSIDESSALDGKSASRTRRWDSCFTQAFTYIHGGSVRLSPKSRLRQRITHKFASWQDQFGEIGCTGCGRCIAWCPAGIDVTEELAALRAAAPGVSP